MLLKIKDSRQLLSPMRRRAAVILLLLLCTFIWHYFSVSVKWQSGFPWGVFSRCNPYTGISARVMSYDRKYVVLRSSWMWNTTSSVFATVLHWCLCEVRLLGFILPTSIDSFRLTCSPCIFQKPFLCSSVMTNSMILRSWQNVVKRQQTKLWASIIAD